MHTQYFPRCPVDGPIDPPVPFSHMVSVGAVPNKCGHCDKLFEGECIRCFEQVERFLHLDHGPCGVPGPTDPVKYEDSYITARVTVPRKCAKCGLLAVDSICGFHCTKEADKWGGFHRGLDWGAWEPDSIYLELPPPKVSTRALCQCARDNDLVSFVKEHRRINPGLSIEEAKADFRHFRSILSATTS